MEAASTPPADPGRPHRKSVVALTVVASLLAFLAVFSIWANRQLLNTDDWVETSSELLEDQEIRTQLADFITDEIFTSVDVEAKLQSALPKQLQPLAGPASAGIRQLTNDAANELLQRPRVQSAWETINRAMHQRLLQVLEDDSGDGVSLDLGSLVTEVGNQAGVDVSGKIPADAGEIQVLPPEELTSARKVVNLIEKLAVVLTLLALALFALAIYLARGWRREALRSIGFAFIIVGILVSVARALAGDYIVDTLATTAAVQPAVKDTWEISTSLLAAGGGAMVFYGIVIVLGAWLAGPGSVASSVRRAITPLMEQRLIGYAFLFLLLVLLFWWAPTEGFKRLPTSILIVALMVAGFEFLRHKAISDFPGETWEKGTERWRQAGRSLLDRGKRGGAG